MDKTIRQDKKNRTSKNITICYSTHYINYTDKKIVKSKTEVITKSFAIFTAINTWTGFGVVLDNLEKLPKCIFTGNKSIFVEF